MSEADLDHAPVEAEPGDGPAPVPPAPVVAKRKVSLTDMIWTANDEAERIENAERAAVKAGLRAEPLPERMDRAHNFRSMATLFAEVEPIWDTVVRPAIIDRRRKRGRK